VNSDFACVSQSQWLLSARIDDAWRQKLLKRTTFEAIVDRIVATAALVHHKRARVRDDDPTYYRVEVTLNLEQETACLFHNSRCGYRAQYYDNTETGERANRFALSQIVPRLKNLISGNEKRTCPLDWIETSLLDAHAKIWIHQGKWAYYKRHLDRNMCIERWKLGLNHENPSKIKKARLGILCPLYETRIDLLGGFINLKGSSLDKSLKPCRSQDIHDFGFT
jgi:hypothetical protein